MPVLLSAALALAVLLTPGSVAAQSGIGSASQFRLFLLDGRSLTSFGEWMRSDGRVVFSMPVAETAGSGPSLHLITLPETTVDWPRTERYAEAARAAHYAATRGDADFAALGEKVANTLNTVSRQADPRERLAIAEGARRELGDWPGTHFGYRADEVREVVGLLDGIIAQMRAAEGLGHFDLALTSSSAAASTSEALLPPPGLQETLEQLTTAWSLVETGPERQSLLRTVLGLLDRASASLPREWATRLRRATTRALADEAALDRRYDRQRTVALELAARYAQRADVQALERLRAQAVQRDRRWGQQRPGEFAALLATLDVHTERARSLRLKQDQWRLRADGYAAYRRALRTPLGAMHGARGSLERIRDMSGPEPRALFSLTANLKMGTSALATVVPPDDLRPIHSLLQSASTLAHDAARLRLDAASANSLDRARQASAAAAGALLFLTRAREDLERAVARPLLP